MKKLLYALLLCMFAVCGASANNIRIIGIPKLDQDTLTNTAKITFDIAWDNSWNTSKPANYDAAWIFVKCWDGETWNHVYLEEKDKSGKPTYRPGSKIKADAVNPSVTYYVSDREGKITDLDMVLEPGYSMAWKEWRLDPDEKAQKCVVGYFLYRKGYGAGDVVVPGVQFLWNYDSQGFVDEDDLVVKVFAVEMVYVPKGDYYLGGIGDPARQVGAFTTNGNTFGTPMVIRSEGEILVENTTAANTLWANNDAITEGKIPAAFPKGHQAFYIMKYEMTQEAYCEFLNCLNQGQQNGRIEGRLDQLAVGAWAWGGDIRAWRNYVKIKRAAPTAEFACDADHDGVFNETDTIVYRVGKPGGDNLVRNIDGQDLAVNFVSVFDLLAYAEFAGLRPMTELEYEKACRGSREPVNNEYAWGSVTLVFCGQCKNSSAGSWDQNSLYTDVNTGTERLPAGYNAAIGRMWTASFSSSWWGGKSHTDYITSMRVGIFADSVSTRAAAGATYWGVMNMSDNTVEVCISVVDTTGRKFEGSHGSGKLGPNGEAICEDWHISSAPRYYITRGMQGVRYAWVTSGNCPGARTDTRWNYDEPCWTCGIERSDIWAGMISSRHRWNQTAQNGELRNYTGWGNNNVNTNNPAMLGIRCVRTQNAQK